MDIFYLKKSEFIPHITYESLKTFSDGREFKCEEKELEHLCGIFLTKFIAKHAYDVHNLEIELRNKKPHFVSNEIYFSISHSKDVVLVVFNNSNIGADVEYMKDSKNYKLIMNRYGHKVTNPTKKDFYRFWTVHEAEIKLNAHIRSLFSKTLEDNYMLACVSDNIFVSNFCIKKLSCTGENIDLSNELKYPKNIKFSSI
ncbi:hypothetical protein HDR58_06280 [bacterium]|nr:hypothetical protein [bacterium]